MYKTCFLIKYVHKFNVFIFSCVFGLWFLFHFRLIQKLFGIPHNEFRIDSPTSVIIMPIMPKFTRVKMKSRSVCGASTTSRLPPPECAVKLRFIWRWLLFECITGFSLSLSLSLTLTLSPRQQCSESLCCVFQKERAVCVCTHSQ